MRLRLAENIRACRKERKLTQEKLAEALGVTPGAVHKWESGQSVPELPLIAELADFFDTSVDALIGFTMKDNRLEATISRLTGLCRNLDPSALAEAEKALAKYPYSFQIVFLCAGVYTVFAVSGKQKEHMRRALALLEQAEVLLPQNDDPRIGGATIRRNMATVLFLMGDKEKSLELFRQNNADCVNSSVIGLLLALYMDRPEEAGPYLSEALADSLSGLLNTVLGYAFVFRSRGDWASALEIVSWGIRILSGIKQEAASSYLDKTLSEMLALLAYAQAKSGLPEAARASLAEAGKTAERFDSTPDYSLKAIRFAEHMEHSAVFDILGTGARESVGRLIGLLDDPALAEQWKEVCDNEP